MIEVKDREYFVDYFVGTKVVRKYFKRNREVNDFLATLDKTHIIRIKQVKTYTYIGE